MFITIPRRKDPGVNYGDLKFEMLINLNHVVYVEPGKVHLIDGMCINTDLSFDQLTALVTQD